MTAAMRGRPDDGPTPHDNIADHDEVTVDRGADELAGRGGSLRVTCVLDLRSDAGAADRLALRDVGTWWPGARVEVQLGGRTRMPATTIHLLAEQLDRVHLELKGTPAAVRSWGSAIENHRRGIDW